MLTDNVGSSGEGGDVIDIQLKTVVLSRPASLQPTPTTPTDSGSSVSLACYWSLIISLSMTQIIILALTNHLLCFLSLLYFSIYLFLVVSVCWIKLAVFCEFLSAHYIFITTSHRIV